MRAPAHPSAPYPSYDERGASAELVLDRPSTAALALGTAMGIPGLDELLGPLRT